MSPPAIPAQVLVVDDDDDLRAMVAKLLVRAGMHTLEAADGNEGLRKFFASRPDLVVLDVSMPGMDGFAVLERIRDLSDVPVLLLTAHGVEMEKVRGLQAGADDYVTKPFGRRSWSPGSRCCCGAAARGRRRRRWCRTSSAKSTSRRRGRACVARSSP